MDGDRILRTAIVGLRHDHVGSFGQQSPGYLHTLQPHRFNPVARDLRRLIERGVLGRPLDLEVRLITGQVRSGVRDPSSFLYSREAEGGGVLHMLGGHYIDVMRFPMGDEVRHP